MRLDKFLCETLNISRKESKSFFKINDIKVNGQSVKDSGIIINENIDTVLVNGEPLIYEKYVYYMLNKPSGYVTARTDNISKTVMDLFKDKEKDLSPVGRLDKDTVGLLLITNDGALNHHLTSPKHHVPKTYYVKTKHILSSEDINKLERGIDLKEDGITSPAKVKIIKDNEIELTINEGKYHQVKRMLLAVNNEVVFLKRLSMGSVFLDKNLKEGEFRRLSSDEIEHLLNGEENL